MLVCMAPCCFSTQQNHGADWLMVPVEGGKADPTLILGPCKPGGGV